MNLGDNRLVGAIPSQLGLLKNLEYLELYQNGLTGPIPSKLGNLSKLKDLRLYNNFGLSGSIPKELGNLNALEKLHLSNNQLSGHIPLNLCQLPNLQQLDLSYNALVADDSELRDCLSTKAPDWETTQRLLSPEKLQLLPTDIPAGQVWFNPVDEAIYVYVPAGEFIMGSELPSRDPRIAQPAAACDKVYPPCTLQYFSDEAFKEVTPVFTTTVNGFWIMQTEVTNAQYQRFTDATDYPPPATGWDDPDSYKPDRPVFGVSWADAVAYTTWLSRETGLTVRLPTEAEWEKAARGTDGRIYPWGNEWDPSRVNYCDTNGKPGECEKDGTFDDDFAFVAPVGSYPQGASPYNVLDMAGNVWEWTNSLAKAYPYRADDGREDANASGPRVRRGGSFNSMAGLLLINLSGGLNPDEKRGDMGFRVVVVQPANQ